jgi:hypothetical protein
VRLPSRRYELPEGLVCEAIEIQREAWQAHVAKHPLGVWAIARSGRQDAWNAEGWDRLEPPVVTAEQRETLLQKIRGLSEGSLRCEVPELRGKVRGSNPDRLACYDCKAPVIVRCEASLGTADGPGPRYAAVTEQLLAAAEGEALVSTGRAALTMALHRLWQSPHTWKGLIVLSAGVDDRQGAQPIVRITRADGVRAEFYLNASRTLRWRTTYRNPAPAPAAQLSQLLDFARPSAAVSTLSDRCMVPRPWWETYGR